MPMRNHKDTVWLRDQCLRQPVLNAMGGSRWPPTRSQRPVMDMGVGGADEPFEQGMGLVGFAAELGMKLAGDEERVVGNFNHLHQFAVGRSAAEDEVGLLELVAVGVIEFVAVAVPFVDDEGAVEFGGEGAHDQ